MPSANFEAITKHAYDTVKYLRSNDPKVAKSYVQFLKHGEDAPGFAKLKLIEAVNDSFAGQNSKSHDNIKKRGIIIQKLEKLKEKFKFENLYLESNYNKMYPDTANKRKAIENYFLNLGKNSSNIKTSKMKLYKKIMAYYYKMAD